MCLETTGLDNRTMAPVVCVLLFAIFGWVAFATYGYSEQKIIYQTFNTPFGPMSVPVDKVTVYPLRGVSVLATLACVGDFGALVYLLIHKEL